MPRGASAKREREYEELKDRFEEEHRYPGREEEVAARIVNKQRRMQGETKGEKEQEKHGENPDRNLPIGDYRHLTVGQIKGKLDTLSKKDIRKVADYERAHKNRRTLIHELEQRAA